MSTCWFSTDLSLICWFPVHRRLLAWGRFQKYNSPPYTLKQICTFRTVPLQLMECIMWWLLLCFSPWFKECYKIHDTFILSWDPFPCPHFQASQCYLGKGFLATTGHSPPSTRFPPTPPYPVPWTNTPPPPICPVGGLALSGELWFLQPRQEQSRARTNTNACY